MANTFIKDNPDIDTFNDILLSLQGTVYTVNGNISLSSIYSYDIIHLYFLGIQTINQPFVINKIVYNGQDLITHYILLTEVKAFMETRDNNIEISNARFWAYKQIADTIDILNNQLAQQLPKLDTVYANLLQQGEGVLQYV